MARWEWRAYDLASGAALAVLDMAEWSHTDVLNDSGTWSATMLGRTPAARRDAIGATTPGRSVVVPIRNGVPLGFAGIVWRSDPPNIAGAGLLSYFDAQPLYETKTYVAEDQHLLVADLVDWVQSHDGGIQVDTSQVGTSGVARTQTWNIWELKSVGEAMRQKSDNLDGFELDVRVEYDAGVLVRRLRLWTPRRGRYYVDSQSNPTFRLDGRRGNVRTAPSVPRDATQMVTHVYGKGQEVDSTTHERLVTDFVRTDLRDAGWPRLGKALDLSDVKELGTLQEHVDGYAYLHGAAEVDSIVLDVDPDHSTWPWGSWDLGDDGKVVMSGDEVEWMPDGYNETRRVTAHGWTWSSSKGEALKVTAGKLLGE